MCRVVSCVVGSRCLLWPVHSLGRTVSLTLLYSVLRGQTCLFLQVSLDFLLLHSSPVWWKGHLFFFFFGVSSRRSCRSSQNHSTSASLALVVDAQTWITVILNGLPWKQTEIILISDFSTWDCTQVLHFRLFSWLWGLLYFFWGILVHSSRCNGHLN